MLAKIAQKSNRGGRQKGVDNIRPSQTCWKWMGR